jgi:hypothetical protein
MLTLTLPANKLIEEESPYLQQHAHNPVDWYAWGEEAFEKAKQENKMIFLSIGYSTCHWCHVMEKESFENKAIAKQLNQNFISIKVDREEYPHIDKYYQSVYRMMNKNSGGWPLTIIMTPDKKVFFSTTYLAPEPKYGQQGLINTLNIIIDTFKNEKEVIFKDAQSIEAVIKKNLKLQNHKQTITLNQDIASTFLQQIKSGYDHENKGMGSAPKFPQATTWLTLLNIYKNSHNKEALDLATQALTAMAQGGIYDQIEGGFYRYAVDMTWTIPHFEKMLYTNAELLESYLEAYKINPKKLYSQVIHTTFSNLEERFKEENLYYSASDADSDGEEGKYFVFKYKDTLKALTTQGFTQKEANEVLEYLNVSSFGNFEKEQNNPSIDVDSVYPMKLGEAKTILKNLRKEKNYPFIDKKIQTSWNSLLIGSLFKAGEILDKKYTTSAILSLDSLIEKLYVNQELYHQVLLGKKPKVKAYLEDYAFLISTLIKAHQETLEKKYLILASTLSKKAQKKFYKNKQWFMSTDSFTNPADLYDNSYRSALAVMLENLLILGLINEDYQNYHLAKTNLETYGKELNSIPSAFPYATSVVLMLQQEPILIKSSKKNLKKNKQKFNHAKGRNLFRKTIKDKRYFACTMGLCFASEQNMTQLLKKVNHYQNKK